MDDVSKLLEKIAEENIDERVRWMPNDEEEDFSTPPRFQIAAALHAAYEAGRLAGLAQKEGAK